ncbi:putative chitinase 3, partial [Dufourea novaeangliae]
AVAAMATMASIISAETATKCPTIDPANKIVRVAHESDCTKFYKCSMGQKYIQDCQSDEQGRKLHFDPVTEVCVTPRQSQCAMNLECSTFTDGHRWPHPIHCQNYHTCENGRKLTQQCDDGMLFDREKLRCDLAVNVKCKKTKFECPAAGSGSIVRYPHECSCAKYYDCSEGNLVVKLCPSNMLFDRTLLNCVQKQSADCVGKLLPNGCPSMGTIELPHEYNCHQYYMCVDGVQSVQNCKNGLNFDKVKGMCTWWNEVNCGERRGTTPRPDSCSNWRKRKIPDKEDCNRYYECVNGIVEHNKCLEGHCFNEIVESCDLPKNTNCCGGGNHPECPTTDSSCKIRYPHSDCTMYYECRNGRKVPLKCPHGLRYNEVKQMCDLPQNVNCKEPEPSLVPQTTAFPTTALSSTEQSTTEHSTTGEPSTETSSTVAPTTAEPSSEGPTTVSSTTVEPSSEPPETESSTTGEPSTEPSSTASPTTVEPSLEPPTTVFPTTAEPSSESPTTESSTTGEPSTEPSSTVAPTTAEPSSEGPTTVSSTTVEPSSEPPETESSTTGSNKVVRLPHECDCRMYYECVNGTLIRKSCINGTMYNNNTMECVSADETCLRNRISLYDVYDNSIHECPTEGVNIRKGLCKRPIPIITTPTPTTPTPTTPTPTTPTPTTSTIPSPQCYPGWSAPHESDCSMYYFCKNGEKVVTLCPSGTYWDEIRNECDLPENTTCGQRECPNDNCLGKIRYPDPSNCGQYYECKNGRKTLERCSEGLHFNRVTQMCDWPENAGCTPDHRCNEGEKSPHDCQCDLYYICKNGEQVRQSCPVGQWFDRVRKTCDWKDRVVCPSDSLINSYARLTEVLTRL